MSVLITTTIALAMLVVHGFMDNIWLGMFYLCLSPVCIFIVGIGLSDGARTVNRHL
jgi:hypothetical protein